jgi:preprotein translocase subunit SecG
MLINIILGIHILVCAGMMLVVLLQAGKGAGLAGVFGASGGSPESSVFGAKGAGSFLSKMTTAVAVIFMITSLGLAILKNRETLQGKSLLEQETKAKTEEKTSTTSSGAEGKTTKLPQEEKGK